MRDAMRVGVRYHWGSTELVVCKKLTRDAFGSVGDVIGVCVCLRCMWCLQ